VLFFLLCPYIFALVNNL